MEGRGFVTIFSKEIKLVIAELCRSSSKAKKDASGYEVQTECSPLYSNIATLHYSSF